MSENWYVWRIEATVKTDTNHSKLNKETGEYEYVPSTYNRNVTSLVIARNIWDCMALFDNRYPTRTQYHKVIKERPWGEDLILPLEFLDGKQVTD